MFAAKRLKRPKRSDVTRPDGGDATADDPPQEPASSPSPPPVMKHQECAKSDRDTANSSGVASPAPVHVASSTLEEKPAAPMQPNAVALCCSSSSALSYIDQLQLLQKLLREMLQVHTLSSAIEYEAYRSIVVNAANWWSEIERQVSEISSRNKQRRRIGSRVEASAESAMPSDGSSDDEMALLSETLVCILRTLDQVNRSGEKSDTGPFPLLGMEREELLAMIDSAVGFAGAKLLNRWYQATATHDVKDEDAMRFGTSAVNTLLQFVGIGSFHAFHEHILVASAMTRVFRGLPSWKCSVCQRISATSGVAAPMLAYRCAACDFTLCRECFTRIPNAGDGNCASSSERKQPAEVALRIDRFLSLAISNLDEPDNFAGIVCALAKAIRRRVYELPLFRSVEMGRSVHLLVEMLSCPPVALQLVQSRSCDWFPQAISLHKMAYSSFLGPFFSTTSISDEPQMIDVSSESRNASETTLSVKWQDGYEAIKRDFTAILRSLVADNQPTYVVDAALGWIGATIAASLRRRHAHHGPGDRMDGFLINLSSALVQLVLPVLNPDEAVNIDAKYHQGSHPRRAFGDKEFQYVPLREVDQNLMQVHCKEEEQLTRNQDRQAMLRRSERVAKTGPSNYYPVLESHFGIVCDPCHHRNLPNVRYKCVCCEDFDLCAKCFEDFSRQAGAALTYERSNGRTGVPRSTPQAPLIHAFDHVFLRVDIPLLLIPAKHLDVLACETHERRSSLHNGRQTIRCSGCARSLDDANIVYKCANCCDSRFVCSDCLAHEERHKDPYKRHVPGHLYFAIPSSWTKVFSVTSSRLRLRTLAYPPSLLPRKAFSKETELFYMTVRILHVGPLQTLSRLIATLKEIYALQTFCFCEEEKRELDRNSRASHRGSPHRPVYKMLAQYEASNARLGDLGANRIMSEMHLLETSNVTEWLMFYSRACKWLLKLASPTQDAFAEVLSDFSPSFSAFPEHFFVDLCDVIYLLGLDCIDFQQVFSMFAKDGDFRCQQQTSVQILEPILVMLMQLVASRRCTKNPHLRVQALKSLSTLLSFFSKSKYNQVVTQVFKRNELLANFAVRGILRFHEDMEAYHVRNRGLAFDNTASSGDHYLWGFLSIRVSVTLLLRYLWLIPNQRVMLMQVSPAVRGFVPTSDANATAAAANQMSVLLSGLMSDAAKLVEEADGKIETLHQLLELQELSRQGHEVNLPFRPAMLDGYIALHAKQLRLTFRMLIEVLELLAWVADTLPLVHTLLKPELVNQCARTVSFLLSTVAVAHKAKSWNFTLQLVQDGKIVLSNLMVLVVRCAGLAGGCAPSAVSRLVQESGLMMLKRVGDLDTRARWALNSVIARLESAQHLCDIADDNDTSEEMTQLTDDDASSEDMDADEALALLEKESATALAAPQLPSSLSGCGDSAHEQKRIMRRLGKHFIAALADDGRFDATCFLEGCAMLQRGSNSWDGQQYEWLDSAWVERFQESIKKCSEMIEVRASVDALLDDAPEEYLDPLLNTIMTDPVRLPSGNIVDRSVIERHLLSSQHVDPFTRKPLSVDMLTPCDALRNEIRMYLRSKVKHIDSAKEDVLATWGLAWDALFDADDDSESTIEDEVAEVAVV